MRSRVGFTLIELLVVIAIIGILAAILFPVFAEAREKARQISCASNEKQISLAIIQYTEDYDERWPIAVVGSDYGWVGRVYTYVKSTNVFKCPDDPTKNASDTQIAVSYGLNYNLSGGASRSYVTGPATISRLQAPSSTVLLCEIRAPGSNNVDYNNPNEANSQDVDGGDSGTGNCGYIWYQNFYASGPMGQPSRTACIDPNAPQGRHTDMSNFAFCDGHVKAIKGQYVSAGQSALQSSCDQDASGCSSSGYGNAAGTSFMGQAPKNFIATFSPI